MVLAPARCLGQRDSLRRRASATDLWVMGPFALAPAGSRASFPRDFPRRSHSPRSFPRNIPRRSRGPALACPPLSASVIGGRTTSLSKQSLRTCNVDNELRQALVLLRCPPILADWRTTINAELAHYPR